MRGRLTAGLLAALLSLASAAHADTAKARELYTRATRAYNLQKFEQSLTLFQQSYEEREDPATLYNIGQCQRQLGQFEAAAKSYRVYLTQEPKAPNRNEVVARIDEMEEQARAQRAAEAQKAAAAAAVAAPPATVTPPPVTPEAAVVATRPARGSRTLRLAGIGVGAGGVALLALGGAFAALSKSAGQDAYRGPVYDYQADDRQKNYRAADIACFTLGGVALLGGVTLYALGARR